MSNSIVYHDFAAERRELPVSVAVGNDDDEIDLRQYANILYESRWLVILTMAIGILCSALYIIAVKPMYETNFMIHVEEDGEKQSNTMFNEMGSMFKVKTSASAEVELVKSRQVISRALDNLNIYVSSEPRYFPVVGRWLAMKDWQLSIPPGFGGYVWHMNEELKIINFMVPGILLNQEFILTALGNNQFDLQDKKGTLRASGKVNVPLEIDYRAGPVKVLIGTLNAPPGARFILRRSSKLAMIEAIQSNLSAAEQGKQSAVVNVVLRGTDPQQTNNVLAEIARQYAAQNAARKTQEAQKALAFLDKQLPELKQQLEQSEGRYNQFRNSKGTVDLAEEAKSDLQQLALAKTRKAELEQKRTELLVRFTPNHPVVEGLDTQRQIANNDIKTLTGHIKSLPLIEQELLKLSRDVKINTDLYTSLLNTARQLKLVTVSAETNIRLVDMPTVPEKPVSLSAEKLLGLGIFGGLLAGIAAAFTKRAFKTQLESATELEKASNIPVFAEIPFSSTQQKLQAQGGKDKHRKPLLARDAPADKAIESLRSLRAVLRFAVPHSKNNVTLLISPSAGNGKSFISTNLAAVMGAGGMRILLIDADLRNGDLHQYFGLWQSPGLAEALAGTANMDAIIRPSVYANVDFIASGAMASELDLLMQPRLGELLRTLASHYDMVLVNGAPLLEVSDSLAVAAQAGAIYIVARAGVSTSYDVAETSRILRQAGFAAKGCLLNGIKNRVKTFSSYRYGYTQQWQARYPLKNLAGADVADAVVKMK